MTKTILFGLHNGEAEILAKSMGRMARCDAEVVGSVDRLVTALGEKTYVGVVADGNLWDENDLDSGPQKPMCSLSRPYALWLEKGYDPDRFLAISSTRDALDVAAEAGIKVAYKNSPELTQFLKQFKTI